MVKLEPSQTELKPVTEAQAQRAYFSLFKKYPSEILVYFPGNAPLASLSIPAYYLHVRSRISHKLLLFLRSLSRAFSPGDDAEAVLIQSMAPPRGPVFSQVLSSPLLFLFSLFLFFAFLMMMVMAFAMVMVMVIVH